MMNYGYPSYFQPLLNAQQRIDQFNQQYPQFAQQPTQQQQTSQQQVPSQTLLTIPVSTIEEAKAYIVDPLGIPTLFYNAGKNEVYLKRINKDTAEAEFFVFSKREQSVKEVKEQSKVEKNYEDDFKKLNDKIDGLHSILEKNSKTSTSTDKGGKNAK